MFKRVLILSPHTDDGELGCGAAIAKFIDEGKEVFYAALSACETSVPKEYPEDILKQEVKKATDVLGIDNKNLLIHDYEVRRFPEKRQQILDTLLQLKRSVEPDLILTHCSYDMHQDHKVTHEETLRAFKHHSILGYEQPWNNITFDTVSFIPLDEKHVQKKIDALKCYESQKTRNYLNETFIKSLARTRGVQINTEYAEAFEVVRWILK